MQSYPAIKREIIAACNNMDESQVSYANEESQIQKATWRGSITPTPEVWAAHGALLLKGTAWEVGESSFLVEKPGKHDLCQEIRVNANLINHADPLYPQQDVTRKALTSGLSPQTQNPGLIRRKTSHSQMRHFMKCLTSNPQNG